MHKDAPPPEGGGRNPEVDFHGEKRLPQTHASTTDPEARLFRKGKGKEARLCFMGHVLMENCHGLIISPASPRPPAPPSGRRQRPWWWPFPAGTALPWAAIRRMILGSLSNLCGPLRPCPMWPKTATAGSPPLTAEPPAIRGMPSVSACEKGWRKSSAG